MKLFLVFSLLIVGSISTDYCNKELCKRYNGVSFDYDKHIACGNPGTLAPACSADTQAFNSAPYQTQILNKLNTLRNALASGTEGFPAAAKMRELIWSPELADLALLNIKNCDNDHDKCHNTDQFTYSGQNLAGSGTSGTVDVKTQIDNFIQTWYDEKNVCPQDVITKYYQTQGVDTGHFTAVVCDRQTEVGCAHRLYSGGGFNRIFFACNFASTNMMGFPIYKSSSTPASGCSKKSASYPNLCDKSEIIDVNKFY